MSNNGLCEYASSPEVDSRSSSSERHYDQRNVVHYQAAHSSVVRSTGITEHERRQSPPPPLPPKASSIYRGLQTRPHGRSIVVSDESDSSPPPLPPKASSSKHETRLRKTNVVFFGESGSGKSSVINAITQTQRAKTSSDATACTFSYQCYAVDISDQSYVLFDTAGLNEGNISAVPAAKAETELKSLLRGLMSPGSDGIGLLVYCVRSTRAHQALIRNYDLFYSVICRKKVPIVVVITGLENEADMQAWWHTNAKEFKSRGMHFQDHACVTTLHKHIGISDVFTRRITESREMMRNLIVNNCSEWAVDDTWFNQSFADARYVMRHNWNSERSSPSTLIICGASPKEVEGLAHFGGEAYRVRPVPQPESTSSAGGGHEGDLLIYYAHADTLSMARQMFHAFYTAYRGNMVPVVVVVKGLNDRKSARQWVDRYIKHHGAGLLFSTFSPADLGDNYLRRHAEQDLHDLIRQSCLIRSVVKGGGVLKRFARLLGWP
ncbi:hypothetical protein BDR05DRAFT_66499 [Suillus weaverae]|nr:hypothetical protein BDR05DRAFT_66499 [Suillus weaverae]